MSSVGGLYSHNDENQTHPFDDAHALGFEAYEVDVFLISGVLRCGHDATAATTGPTLAAAYLDKIVALAHNQQPKRLSIDLKDNPSDTSFSTLMTLLGTYSDLSDGHMPLTCTGFRPSTPATPPLTWVKFGRSRSLGNLTDAAVAHIEIDFSSFSTWTGTAPVPPDVRENLLLYANEAHAHGKQLRIFFAPETILSWQTQYDCGCDWIQPSGAVTTDNIAALAAWRSAL